MLLDGLSDEERALFAGICKIAVYKPEQVIVKEGDTGDTMLLIRKGKAEVRKHLRSNDYKFLKELKPGDFVGEMSYLNHAPRSADVVAVDGCEILEFRMVDFDDLCLKSPGIGLKIYKNMATEIAQRLKRNNEDLRKAVMWATEGSF